MRLYRIFSHARQTERRSAPIRRARRARWGRRRRRSSDSRRLPPEQSRGGRPFGTSDTRIRPRAASRIRCRRCRRGCDEEAAAGESQPATRHPRRSCRRAHRPDRGGARRNLRRRPARRSRGPPQARAGPGSGRPTLQSCPSFSALRPTTACSSASPIPDRPSIPMMHRLRRARAGTVHPSREPRNASHRQRPFAHGEGLKSGAGPRVRRPPAQSACASGRPPFTGLTRPADG
jgi:hypothetical protein